MRPADAADFFGENGFVPARLGAHLSELGHLKLGHDGRLWRYLDGVYRPDGELWAASQIRELLGERCRKRQLDEVRAWLRAALPEFSVTPDRHWLNLADCLLDWRTGETIPHSPELASSIRIPVRWRPDATCARIDRFLLEVLPPDAIDFVFELVGYCLYPANPLQRAVLLFGPGGNGKGVLLGLIRALLGKENVSALSLHALAENRFAPVELYGRLANICGDLDARSVERSDVFKQVTGGDPIAAERKYGGSFTFTAFAKLIFAANEPPPSSDQSQAYFDRWLILPMTRRFRGGEREDPHLLQKLTSAAELEGLLVRAVVGLRRLSHRRQLELPDSVAAASEAYRHRLDSVRAFIEDACELTPLGWSPRPAVYSAYSSWCQQNGRQRLASATFYERLLAAAPALSITTRRGMRGFDGVTLHPFAPPNAPQSSSEGAKGAEFPLSPPIRADERGVEKTAPPAPPAPNGHRLNGHGDDLDEALDALGDVDFPADLVQAGGEE